MTEPHPQPETRGRKRYGHPINIHPLCCKNCICFSVINQTNYCSSLDGVPRFISRSQIYFIERVGCASHTPAAPAERLCDECNIIELEEKLTNLEQQIKDEHEKVIEILSDLNKYSCEEYEEASLSDNEREMRIHLEYGNRTWGIIRSLRGGAP